MLKFKKETEFKDMEIGKIPKDWEVDILREAVRSLESGNRPKGGKLQHDPNGVLSIGGENITWEGDLILNDCLRFSENFYKDLNKGKIEPDDILLVKDGATIGKLAYVKEIPEGKAMINEHVFLIKTDKEKYNSKFLFYFLLSESGQIQIESSITGTAQGGLNRNILNIIKVPILDLPEQSRIATVLSWFDDLIENKKKQNEILENTAMAIFKSWFVDFEPFKDQKFVYCEELDREIPEGWEVKTLGEIAKVESGGNAPQKQEYFINGKYPFVRVKHLSKGPCMVGSDFINDKAVYDYNLKIFHEGSVIIQKSGESLKEARVNLLPFEACVVNHLAVFDSHANFEMIDFIFCYLKETLNELIEGQSGTALPYLRMSDIINYPVCIPSQLILKKFCSLVKPLFQKIILNQKELMVLRKIRDALLPQLVFGKLRVVEI